MSETVKTNNRRVALIIGGVVLVACICLFALIALLVLTGVIGGLGRANVRFPRYSSSTRIEIEDDDLADLLYDYTSWPLPFASDVQLYWTEDDGDDVEDELDDRLKDADWDDEEDWSDRGNRIDSVWEKEDVRVEYIILPEIDDDTVDSLDDDYDIVVEEDATVVIAIGWDMTRPASTTGTGWGTCDFPESDLTIACLDSIPYVGDTYEEEDGFWDMETGFGYLSEVNQEGLDYLEDMEDVRLDLEDSPEDIFEEIADENDWDYEQEDLERVRTGAGRMLVGLYEDSYGDPGIVGLLIYEDETLIIYSAFVSEDYDENVVFEFHKDVIGSISRE